MDAFCDFLFLFSLLAIGGGGLAGHFAAVYVGDKVGSFFLGVLAAIPVGIATVFAEIWLLFRLQDAVCY